MLSTITEIIDDHEKAASQTTTNRIELIAQKVGIYLFRYIPGGNGMSSKPSLEKHCVLYLRLGRNF